MELKSNLYTLLAKKKKKKSIYLAFIGGVLTQECPKLQQAQLKIIYLAILHSSCQYHLGPPYFSSIMPLYLILK